METKASDPLLSPYLKKEREYSVRDKNKLVLWLIALFACAAPMIIEVSISYFMPMDQVPFIIAVVGWLPVTMCIAILTTYLFIVNPPEYRATRRYQYIMVGFILSWLTILFNAKIVAAYSLLSLAEIFLVLTAFVGLFCQLKINTILWANHFTVQAELERHSNTMKESERVFGVEKNRNIAMWWMITAYITEVNPLIFSIGQIVALTIDFYFKYPAIKRRMQPHIFYLHKISLAWIIGNYVVAGALSIVAYSIGLLFFAFMFTSASYLSIYIMNNRVERRLFFS